MGRSGKSTHTDPASGATRAALRCDVWAHRVRVSRADLSERIAERTGFGHAKLRRVKLFSANLNHSTFAEADLSHAELRRASLRHCRLQKAQLSHAEFHHTSPLTPYYFSWVTLTTLGYGDVLPASTAAQVVVMLEVFAGYMSLGGLLSIFSNKMARRGS